MFSIIHILDRRGNIHQQLKDSLGSHGVTLINKRWAERFTTRYYRSLDYVHAVKSFRLREET